MHIPDGFISGPINIGTAIVSTGVGAAAVARAKKTLGDRQVPLLGISAAFVFAAQMLNFPIAGGTSGHFLGAMLVAVLLGPLNGFLVIAVVLAIQCLLFADGGLTALGTNIFNMGIVAGLGGYYLFMAVKTILPKGKTSFLSAVALGSWLSVVIASAFCALELALSGATPLRIVLPSMVGVHALIGVGEAIITTAVLTVVLGTRPDLIKTWKTKELPGQIQEAKA